MVTVPRHATDEEWAEEQLEYYRSVVTEGASSVEKSAERLSVLHTEALNRLGYELVLDPPAKKLTTWDATVQAMQVSTAIFAAAGATEPVPWLIGEEEIQVPATGPVYFANFSRWFDAFWLSVITRDGNRTRMLASMPLEVITASGEPYDEYELKWARSLQMFTQRESGLAETFAQAMAATEPEQVRTKTREHLLRVVYPPMKMFFCLIQSNQEENFNEALVQALEQHKTYWTEDSQKADNPLGMVALAPLAIACMARDADMDIQVESDYIPQHLLSGSWVGEYRTS